MWSKDDSRGVAGFLAGVRAIVPHVMLMVSSVLGSLGIANRDGPQVMMPSRVGRCQDSSPVTRMKRRDDALPCWRVAESGCGRERLQSSAVRTGGLTSVSCVFAVLDGAWQRVSRLTVVPRGLHLRYLCADRFDTASTTRGISTTLLRISGADEHRYARYGRASTTDTADTHSERMVSRCIKTAPEGYRTKCVSGGGSVGGAVAFGASWSVHSANLAHSSRPYALHRNGSALIPDTRFGRARK